MPAPSKIKGAVQKLVDRAIPHRTRGRLHHPASLNAGDKLPSNPGVEKAKALVYRNSLEARRADIPDIFQKATLKKRSRGLFRYLALILAYKPFGHATRRRDKPITLGTAKRMKASLQFVTTPTADTPGTTLLLHFDDKRYLFGNLSEGTQRACVQRKFGLAKISDIFLTGTTTWHATGGLLGIILTVADALSAQNADNSNRAQKQSKGSKRKGSSEVKRRLTIHGGRNLTHLLATARKFVFRKGTPIDVEEIQEDVTMSLKDIGPTWKDSNINIWAMTVPAGSKTRKRSHDEMLQVDAAKLENIDSVAGASSSNFVESTEKPESEQDLEHETDEQLEERNMQFRRGVVGHMFDSDWRLDSLREIKLADVKLPAAIFVRKPGGHIEKYNGPLPGGDETLPNIDVLIRRPWPGANAGSLPPTTPSDTAISYIVKTHTQRGRFLPDAAKKLGVKPGAAFSKLTNGISITTVEGKLVTPEMVMDPDRPGHGFAILEIPSISHVEGVLDRTEWTNVEVMKGVDTVVWILGKGVASDTRITAFITKHETRRHLISSPDVSPNRLAMESPATAAIKLHQVDPERFPIPAHSNTSDPGASLLTFQQAKAGAVLNLLPNLEYDESFIVPDLDTTEVMKTTDNAVLVLAEEARQEVNNPTYQVTLDKQQYDLPSRDAEVITLGTGSALPSKYRNVSATLLRVPGYGNYLFDCGENTLGQMKRVFGAELPQIIRDLKVIWISHLHADHHLGTVSVIKAWHDETKQSDSANFKKLILASDSAMIQWLSEYAEIEDYGHERLHTLSMDELNNHVRFSVPEGLECGLSSIRACRVSHCLGALAVVFDFPNGFKVAYSGDCRPSDDFARLGKGATLLIHEATFDDELQGDAIAKKHSTTAEALDIGRKMGARRILLTHFSQRYQKIPVMSSEDSDQIAIVAFDYMRCRIGDFAKLAAYRPALLELYKEVGDEREVILPHAEPLLLAE